MLTDRDSLLHQQYRDASNLEKRIALHRRFSTNSYPWFRWVFDCYDLPPRARLLELGTGPGDLWLENKKRIPAGWRLTLTDLSTGMARQGGENLRRNMRRNTRRIERPFHYAAADAQDLPFPSNRFDAVIANHMLYHVPDLERSLAEIARVLRPEGKLYAATNGNRHMQDLYDLVNAFLPGLNYGVREYSFGLENGAASLAPYFSQIQLLRYENGLRVTEVEPLAAYVLSMSSSYRSGIADRLADFYDYLKAEMTRGEGEIYIGKDVGMFIANK